jgi:hypothetical protein
MSILSADEDFTLILQEPFFVVGWKGSNGRVRGWLKME